MSDMHAQDQGGGAAPAGQPGSQPSGNPFASGQSAPAQGGGAPGAAAPPGASAATDPWYRAAGMTLDADTVRFLDGKNFPSLGDALKAARHADEVVRARNVWTQPDAKDPSKWDHWKDLGWEPDKDKYALERPAALKDRPDYDADLHETVRATAHELRIPVKAAQGLFDKALTYMAEKEARVMSFGAAENEKQAASLKADWGRDYDGNVAAANRALRATGMSADDVDQLESQFGAAKTLKLLYGIGRRLGEDTLVTSGEAGAGLTPQGAAAEQARLSSDPAFMKSMSDPRDPQHQQNSERWARLSAAKVAQRPAR